MCLQLCATLSKPGFIFIFFLNAILRARSCSTEFIAGEAPDMTEEQIERPSPAAVGVAHTSFGYRASSCILSE